MSKHLRVSGFLLAALLTLPVRLAAEEGERFLPRISSGTFIFENDTFAGTDEGYTTGLRLAVAEPWSGNDPNAPWVSGWRGKLVEVLTGCRPGLEECYEYSVGYALTQLTYTPENLSRRDLIAGDRPYGGWLHATFRLALSKDPDRRHDVDVGLGIVGPSSRAEDVQTFAHKVIGSEEPLGWDNQLRDEVTLQLGYLYRRRFVEFGENQRIFDLVGEAGGAFGNAFIFGSVGATARLGYALSDFAQGRIEKSGLVAVPVSRWEAYVFASVQGRVMGRNIFLDGNTFSDSHSVERKDFVNHVDLGFAVRYRQWRLTYRAAVRSPEFEGSRQHEYGSFALTYSLDFQD